MDNNRIIETLANENSRLREMLGLEPRKYGGKDYIGKSWNITLVAQPYDPTPPWLPFIPLYWHMHLRINGKRIFSWIRFSNRALARRKYP